MPDRGPFGFTRRRPDGNRVLDGLGGLPTEPVTHDLGVEPAWLVGLPDGEAVVWAAVGTDGTLQFWG